LLFVAPSSRYSYSCFLPHDFWNPQALENHSFWIVVNDEDWLNDDDWITDDEYWLNDDDWISDDDIDWINYDNWINDDDDKDC
jgi:hypothetical protein